MLFKIQGRSSYMHLKLKHCNRGTDMTKLWVWYDSCALSTIRSSHLAINNSSSLPEAHIGDLTVHTECHLEARKEGVK